MAGNGSRRALTTYAPAGNCWGTLVSPTPTPRQPPTLPDFIDEAELRLAAGARLEVDQAMIPTGRMLPVADLSGRLGDVRLDTCFTELERDGEGRAWVDLAGPDRRARVWLDAQHPYVMLFTGDTLSEDRRRRGLAVEPMTCPPNGFATGQDLVVLDPGQTFQCAWGVQSAGGAQAFPTGPPSRRRK